MPLKKLVKAKPGKAKMAAEPGLGRGGSHSVMNYLTETDERYDVRTLADMFSTTQSSLAKTLGFKPEAFQRMSRLGSKKVQIRLKEMLEILARIEPWAGGELQAFAWYRAYPIPSFGQRTAEMLVREGRADAVRDYLDGVALGSFA